MIQFVIAHILWFPWIAGISSIVALVTAACWLDDRWAKRHTPETVKRINRYAFIVAVACWSMISGVVVGRNFPVCSTPVLLERPQTNNEQITHSAAERTKERKDTNGK